MTADTPRGGPKFAQFLLARIAGDADRARTFLADNHEALKRAGAPGVGRIERMIWDSKTLDRVRALRCRQDVDEVHLIRGDNELGKVRQLLAKHFVGSAESYGVVIHPADLRFTESKWEDRRFTVAVVCQWWPETDVVRIVGGPRDGLELAVRDKFEPLRVTEFDGPATVHRSAEEVGPDRPPSTLLTACGWSEESRCLLYARRKD